MKPLDRLFADLRMSWPHAQDDDSTPRRRRRLPRMLPQDEYPRRFFHTPHNEEPDDEK